MTTSLMSTDHPTRRRSRIVALDVIRGFALFGILLVNLPPIFELSSVDADSQVWPLYSLLEDTVQNRFFPIFSFLFGIGFGLMWLSAASRSERPRLALLRRFLFLGVLGGLHQLLQPGEALLPYAIAGIVILLPSTWIPARLLTPITAIIGGVLTVLAIATGGGMTIIPGLFLLGFAAGCSGLVRTVLDRPGRLAILGGLTLAVTVVGFALTDFQDRQIHQWINAGLGLAMAFTYVVIILLLMRTPAEVVLRSVFSPLGRMALSNYVGATLNMVAVRLVLPDLARFDSQGGYVAGLAICFGIIVFQVIVSSLWLRFFGQGPLEKLWRFVTWGRSNRTARAVSA